MLGISLVTFVMTRVLPADPLFSILGPFATTEEIALKRMELGLDQPLLVQYGIFLNTSCTAIWATLIGPTNLWPPILRALSRDFRTHDPQSALAVLLCRPTRCPRGSKQGYADRSPVASGLGGGSLDPYFLGRGRPYLSSSISAALAPAPLGRLDALMEPPQHITGMYTVDALLTGNWQVFQSAVAHIALPSITMGFAMIAPILRMTRGSMLEAMNARYVQTALAVGLPFGKVVYQDALRNALLPVVTTMGLIYGWSLGGEVLVEVVFSWPGMGYYAVNSIVNMDYAPVQSFVLVTAAIYVLINLAVDVALRRDRPANHLISPRPFPPPPPPPPSEEMTTRAPATRTRFLTSLRLFWKRYDFEIYLLKRNPITMLGLGIVVMVLLAGILAPVIAPYDPLALNPSVRLQGPSLNNWMGTDEYGRDILSRVLWATQVDRTDCLLRGDRGLPGGPLGSLAGYFRGVWMRLSCVRWTSSRHSRPSSWPWGWPSPWAPASRTSYSWWSSS